jgi:CHASE3 domain sensor protein
MGQTVGNYENFGLQQIAAGFGIILLVFAVFMALFLISRYRNRKYLMAKIRRGGDSLRKF